MDKTNKSYEESIKEHMAMGKSLGIEMSTPLAVTDKLQKRIQNFINELPERGSLKNEEEWDALEAYTMRIPKNLTQLVKKRQQAQDRYDRLVLQERQLKFKLMLTAQENFGNNRLLDTKQKENAILSDDIYEQAIIQCNLQKNLIKYLDETIEQYRYLNNAINTRIEIVKLRKDLGY